MAKLSGRIVAAAMLVLPFHVHSSKSPSGGCRANHVMSTSPVFCFHGPFVHKKNFRRVRLFRRQRSISSHKGRRSQIDCPSSWRWLRATPMPSCTRYAERAGRLKTPRITPEPDVSLSGRMDILHVLLIRACLRESGFEIYCRHAVTPSCIVAWSSGQRVR